MKIDPSLAEFIGALIGDGFIYNKYNKYRIGFVGNIINDKEYFQFLKKLIFNLWGKEVDVKQRCRGLRIVFNSKEAVNFLVNELDMPSGEGKCERVVIPECILNDWTLARHAIRGIADTDGSVFIAKKPGVEGYPSIEITTSSLKLAMQIKEALSRQGFRVANIWSYKSKLSKRVTYKVPLNGKDNVKGWIEKIGFSNPYKLQRAAEFIKN